jgi:hypothetical protein
MTAGAAFTRIWRPMTDGSGGSVAPDRVAQQHHAASARLVVLPAAVTEHGRARHGNRSQLIIAPTYRAGSPAPSEIVSSALDEPHAGQGRRAAFDVAVIEYESDES